METKMLEINMKIWSHVLNCLSFQTDILNSKNVCNFKAICVKYDSCTIPGRHSYL